jgi:hypothetical protein
MSSGEQTENLSSYSPAEDFSPPVQAGGDSGQKNVAPSSTLDIPDLVVKFQLLGAESEALITALRSEVCASGGSERQLASALVERGYLSEEELDDVVLARYLLACAKLTMTQLELVMDEIKDTRSPLWVSLVAKGWLKMSEII